MSHNSRIRTVGTWTGVVTPAEFDTFDQRLFAAINADDGGCWAPAAAIALTGAQTITVSGPSLLYAVHTLTGTGSTLTLSAGSTLLVGGALSFPASAILDCLADSVTAWGAQSTTTWQSGATLTLSSGATTTFGGPTKVTGTPTIQGSFAPTFNASSSILVQPGATWNVAGTINHLTGTITIRGGLTFTSAAAVETRCRKTLSGSAATTQWRYGGKTSDSNSSYDASADSYSVPSLSATRNYTLLHTSGTTPISGSRIKFVGLRGTNGVLFKREDTTTICTTNAPPWWAEFAYYGGAWHCIGWTQIDNSGSPVNFTSLD